MELRQEAVQARVGVRGIGASVDLLGVEIRLAAAARAKQPAGRSSLRSFVLGHDRHSSGTLSRPWRRTLAIQISSFANFSMRFA